MHTIGLPKGILVIKISTPWDVALVISGFAWLYVLGRATGYRLWAMISSACIVDVNH